MSFHRSPAVGAAFFLLARQYLPGLPMNEREIFKAAGVSLEEANAAKADVLDRVYDLLFDPNYDPELTSGYLANVTGIIDEFLETYPDSIDIGPNGRPIFSNHYASFLAVLADQSGKGPGIALSLSDMSELTMVPLAQLEACYGAVKPHLEKATVKPKSKPAAKKRAKRKLK